LETLSEIDTKSNDFVQFEPALAFAVDSAERDLGRKMADVRFPESAVTREIFLEDKKLPEKVAYMVGLGTKYVKLKVGAGLDSDKKNITRVNDLSKRKLLIRLDANRAYGLEEALELARWGKDNNVILFEEPVRGDFPRVKKFRQRSGMPVMLDESIQSLTSLEAAIKAKCFDVLNVKLTRLGGISKAQEYIKICQRAGIKVYLGCSEELAIGTKAILALAKQTKDLYGVEGYGEERLAPYLKKSFEYESGKDNRFLFLAREFWGIWQTRAENVLLKATAPFNNQ